MNHSEIKKFLSEFEVKRERTIVIIDYGNVEKWKHSLGWDVSIRHIAQLERVKYIHEVHNPSGFSKKCDLDVEMTIDLIKMRDNYDTIILFSGDGDLMCAAKYLKDEYGKECYTFGARGHVGREVMDAKAAGDVLDIFYAEDFEYRLNSSYQASRH